MHPHAFPYEERGHGPTMILIPGLDGTALLFYRQVALLEKRFRVITFPLPDDSSCSMESLVADLHQLVEATLAEHGQEKILLCGESFGGALSMSYALAHQEHLMGLVIVNSFPVIRKRMSLLLAPLLLRIFPWGAMKLVRQFTEWKLHSPHAQKEDLAEFHKRMERVGRTGYIRRLEILRSYDIRKQLPEIRVPALCLASDLDRLVPSMAEAKFMCAQMLNAKSIVLKGYGHICLINHDLDLTEYVLPWLNELAGAGKQTL